MSDATLVPIGASVTVAEAVNKLLGFLYEANRATYEIDSDADWRLLHIRCSRDVTGNDDAPWVFSLENAKLSDLQKIYTTGQAEYDPPRIVFAGGGPVANTTTGANGNVTPPTFEQYTSDLPQNTYNYPYAIQVSGGGELPLALVTQITYSITTVQEVGTYIIPIAYHRNTLNGVEVEQVLRSDAPFWPMPKHAVWSKFEKIIGLEASTIIPPP